MGDKGNQRQEGKGDRVVRGDMRVRGKKLLYRN